MNEEEPAWVPKASNKAPQIEAILEKLFPRKESIESKKCVFCGEDVDLESFDDDLSLKEYHISGICQPCQNNTFKKRKA